jgi:hypothetical protein
MHVSAREGIRDTRVIFTDHEISTVVVVWVSINMMYFDTFRAAMSRYSSIIVVVGWPASAAARRDATSRTGIGMV